MERRRRNVPHVGMMFVAGRGQTLWGPRQERCAKHSTHDEHRPKNLEI